MLCPSCGGDSKVIDSRPNGTATTITRRRLCTVCKLRWTTHERDTAHPDYESMAQIISSLRRIQRQLNDTVTKLNALAKGNDV